MTTEVRPTPDLIAATAVTTPARPTSPTSPTPAHAPTGTRAAPTPGGPAGPGLALVDRRSARKARLRRTLAVTFIAVLVVTLFAVGLVQAQLVQRQHRLDELRSEIADTRAQHLRLSREVVVASSPQEVVRRATEMGMVRAQDPVYLVGVRPAGGG